MDTAAIQSTGMNDLTILAIVLASSTVAIVVALAAAAALRLDRWALAMSGRPSILRTVAAIVLGLMAIGILIGIVPGTALLQGWGPVACILVLGSLVSASVAVSSSGAMKAAAAPGAKDSSVSKAAA
jgi:hypothetical protein